MIDEDNLRFEHQIYGLTDHSPVVRDDNDVLITPKRSRNANSEWEVRGYRVYDDGVQFKALSVKQADLAAVLCELFDGDELATNERYSSRTPIRHGIPVAVAVDGKPAIAAWLRIQGESEDEIADAMGVGRGTVLEYLSRLRRRGVGIPDDVDAPAVGTIMPTLPPGMDYSDGPPEARKTGGDDATKTEAAHE